MPTGSGKNRTFVVDENIKQMCEDLAVFYSLHGVKIRIDDIISGRRGLKYTQLSPDALTDMPDLDGSVAPYVAEYGHKRFHLTRYKNGEFGIVDSETSRLYPIGVKDEPNLKWAKRFADLRERKTMDTYERVFIFDMHSLIPLLEWSSISAYKLFDSLMDFRDIFGERNKRHDF